MPQNCIFSIKMLFFDHFWYKKFNLKKIFVPYAIDFTWYVDINQNHPFSASKIPIKKSIFLTIFGPKNLFFEIFFVHHAIYFLLQRKFHLDFIKIEIGRSWLISTHSKNSEFLHFWLKILKKNFWQKLLKVVKNLFGSPNRNFSKIFFLPYAMYFT